MKKYKILIDKNIREKIKKFGFDTNNRDDWYIWEQIYLLGNKTNYSNWELFWMFYFSVMIGSLMTCLILLLTNGIL